MYPTKKKFKTRTARFPRKKPSSSQHRAARTWSCYNSHSVCGILIGSRWVATQLYNQSSDVTKHYGTSTISENLFIFWFHPSCKKKTQWHNSILIAIRRIVARFLIIISTCLFRWGAIFHKNHHYIFAIVPETKPIFGRETSDGVKVESLSFGLTFL